MGNHQSGNAEPVFGNGWQSGLRLVFAYATTSYDVT
jgi:hypothetical protein